jgi:small-conductance mechanosensitive channel
VPLLERQIFLIEMAACVAVLAWCVVFRRPRPSAAVAVSGEPASRAHAQWRPMAWIAAAALLVAFSVALIAGAAGYMRVALLIGGRVLGNGYLALVLYAGVRVGDGLVSLALRVRPLSHLGMVQRHRALLERRAQALLRWAAIAVGVVFALQLFGLWTRAVSVTAAVLGAELRRGAFAIAVEDVVVFTCTVAAAFLVSRVLRFTLEEDVYPRLRLGRGIPSALSGVIHYVLLTVGCLVGLRVLGVDLTKITILASAVGVGVGFGLQGVVNNFVSGMLLRFERKINVGDAVQVGDVAGEIQHVGMRACTVRTAEGAEVIVPNASLTTEKVTNWTLSDRRRRIDMKVGVAYGTHPEAVRGLMLELARAHKLVVEDPPPNALFLGFGDSALLFELRVWTDRFDMWVDIRSELYVALYDALQAADIQIPFPQHEVRVRHV